MEKEQLLTVKRNQLVLHDNIRKDIAQESLQELAQSIRDNGIITPLTTRAVNSHYEVIAGQRRYLASEIAQLEDIPIYVKDISDDEVERIQLIENLHREGLTVMDEATTYSDLFDMYSGDIENVALAVGKTRSYVLSRLRINDLIPEFATIMREKRMSLETAGKVCLFDPVIQKKLWNENAKGATGIISFSQWTMDELIGNLTTVPFDLTDASLDEKRGACVGCPHNSATNSSLFPEDSPEKRCMLIECYEKKIETHFAREIAVAIQDPAVQLVTRNYGSGPDKDVQDLVKGLVVLNRSRYEPLRYDNDRPTLEQYDEDDYDTEQERVADFEEAVARFDKEDVAYKKKVESGKFTKAFVLDGNDRGKYVYIKINAEVAQKGSKENRKTAQAAIQSGEATKDDLQTEIDRIREREKRNKELDYEKVTAALSNAIEKHDGFEKPFIVLSNELLLAMHTHLLEEMYNGRSKIEKHAEKDKTTGMWNLDSKTQAMMFRMILFRKHQGEISERSDGRKFLLPIARQLGIKIADIQKEQDEVSTKREERAKERIDKLKEKQKELGK